MLFFGPIWIRAKKEHNYGKPKEYKYIYIYIYIYAFQHNIIYMCDKGAF